MLSNLNSTQTSNSGNAGAAPISKTIAQAKLRK